MSAIYSLAPPSAPYYGYKTPSSSASPQAPTWGTSPTSPSSSSHPANSIPYIAPPSSFGMDISPLDFGLSLEPVTLTVSARRDANGKQSILSASLLRADGRARFNITTDELGITTSIEDGGNANVAMIHWEDSRVPGNRAGAAAGPTLYVDELGWTMRTADWLYLSSNRTCRTMIAHNRQYSWRPNGTSIELFPLDNSLNAAFALPSQTVLARISQGPTGTMVQLSPRALQLQLLNYVAISAVLLMSGRNID
ncbi:hypothetical protein MKEN_01389200 [Mycena kentingensis (nom. inval.)]|nr:hypothetical protein MKEN_01389200 [Mycena kentingensis (nom. inval.)]